MSTTTTDPQTPAPSRYGADWDSKMAALIVAHNAGLHAGSYRPAACAGCLLSGALETEGVGE